MCVCLLDFWRELTLFRGTESSCSSVIPRQAGFDSRKVRKSLNEESTVRETSVWRERERERERREAIRVLLVYGGLLHPTYFNGVAVTGDVLMVHHHHWYKQLQQITWKQQQAKILLQVLHIISYSTENYIILQV